MPNRAPTATPATAAASWRTAALTLLALLAFAANSLLCRAALRETALDAVSFSALRIAAGAVMLSLLLMVRSRPPAGTSGQATAILRTWPWSAGQWTSAAALFAYAAGFSFAYLQLATGVGALLLFGAVQTTMIGWGLWRGERLRPLQWLGLAAAVAGLVILLWPSAAASAHAPAETSARVLASALMLGAGVAWGIYTLRGRGASDATAVTAGNFVLAVPMAAVLLALAPLLGQTLTWDARGALLAAASGAIASGLGYAIWYAALRTLAATQAAILQLTVPVLAAAAGTLWLGEVVSAKLVLASASVLGGVALVILARPRSAG